MKETPQQKYQRLVNEIQELTQEVDAIQVRWELGSYAYFWFANLISPCFAVAVWSSPAITCFQTATKESSAEERLTPVVLAQQAAQLKQQLVSAHLDSLLGPQAHINLADPDGALARWAEEMPGRLDNGSFHTGVAQHLCSKTVSLQCKYR